MVCGSFKLLRMHKSTYSLGKNCQCEQDRPKSQTNTEITPAGNRGTNTPPDWIFFFFLNINIVNPNNSFNLVFLILPKYQQNSEYLDSSANPCRWIFAKQTEQTQHYLLQNSSTCGESQAVLKSIGLLALFSTELEFHFLYPTSALLKSTRTEFWPFTTTSTAQNKAFCAK